MVYERNAWQDRFNQPSPKDLRSVLEGDAAAAFDHVRQALTGREGVEVRTAWYGPCWCWSIEFSVKDQTELLAVLIPSPEDVQLAMPLDKEFLTQLPLKRMRRAVRDGLELALDPFDSNWSVWSIGPDGLLEELQDVIDRRLKDLRGEGRSKRAS
mgnify:CR=1 FL=1